MPYCDRVRGCSVPPSDQFCATGAGTVPIRVEFDAVVPLLNEGLAAARFLSGDVKTVSLLWLRNKYVYVIAAE